MRPFDIFKIFSQKNTLLIKAKPYDYLPSLWEDDYCQIEIVPGENKEYIINTIDHIKHLAAKSTTDFGFTEIFERKQMPVTTFSKEYRSDSLQQLLTGLELEEAKSINYEDHKILDCETAKIEAFGFSNFTFFFDTDKEFVKNIWISINPTASVKQYDLIKSALYIMGEECEMDLVDWNSLELVDLRNKNHIHKYLIDYWKN